jgi:hypothetical protein
MHRIKISQHNKFVTRAAKHLKGMNYLATSVRYSVASNKQ